ncbi:XRE family transcriptional regulator [Streptomyces sp. NPDC087850]|uniref:XRE family transcriptional regulator n=1 Tax=Streptomyces sp. NPDC087850 TaxID=3365809 RepID=UPI0037FBB94F
MIDDPERTELSDLVRERRAELGLSLRRLAALCVDPAAPGEPLWRYGVIDRLERRLPVMPPRLPELRALAAGLDMPLVLVQGAAAWQFMGIETALGDNRRERRVLELYLALSPADRDRVESILQLWASERRMPR